MPRDRAKVHRRLQEAAMELFTERGYEQTTATQIAARAGVTERTYFRHFADKRDILFEGEEQLEALLVDAIAQAPPQLGPLAVLRRALDAAVTIIEGNRAFSAPRQAVIATTPALREREASKQAALIDAIAAALGRRGLEAKAAYLAARIGGAVFIHALTAWFEEPSARLGHCIDRAFEGLGVLCVK